MAAEVSGKNVHSGRGIASDVEMLRRNVALHVTSADLCLDDLDNKGLRRVQRGPRRGARDHFQHASPAATIDYGKQVHSQPNESKLAPEQLGIGESQDLLRDMSSSLTRLEENIESLLRGLLIGAFALRDGSEEVVRSSSSAPMPAAWKANAAGSSKSIQGDWRSLPSPAWQSIHSRFGACTAKSIPQSSEAAGPREQATCNATAAQRHWRSLMASFSAEYGGPTGLMLPERTGSC